MQRLLFLIKYFCTLIILFMVQKVLFMLINLGFFPDVHFADWLAVIWHGLRLDVVMTCYLIIIPIIITGISCFCRKFALRKVLTWWYVPVSIAMVAAFLGDAIVYHYWGSKLDVAEMIYVQSPKDMLASLPVWLTILIFIALVAVIWSQVWLLRWITPSETKAAKRPWIGGFLTVLLLGVSFLGMRGGVQESTANPSYAYFSQRQSLNHAALNPFFNFLHSMEKKEDLAQEFSFYDEQQLKSITRNIYASNRNIADTLLRTTRPDIMLIVWEGGGSLMTEDDTIAPGFAKLLKQGVFFSNLHANNFRTDRGLVSLLNGWPALPTTSVMKMSGKCHELPSLLWVLSTRGYHSAFYYGGDINFTNMRGYLFETGFDQVYGIDDLKDLPSSGKWGIQDENMLSPNVLKTPPSPYFTACLTLSSHEPWEVPYRRLKDDRENSFAYTDSCLFAYIQQLRQTPAWKNLLVIIVPDHGVAAKGKDVKDAEVSKIPMLWLGGAVRKPCIVPVLMNQSDIAATLLAQMNISSSVFNFSRNVLSPTYKPTYVEHAYKNGINLIDTLGSYQFDLVDGKVIPTTPNTPKRAEVVVKAILQRSYSETAKL